MNQQSPVNLPSPTQDFNVNESMESIPLLLPPPAEFVCTDSGSVRPASESDQSMLSISLFSQVYITIVFVHVENLNFLFVHVASKPNLQDTLAIGI